MYLMLTPERRLQLLEEIRARHAARFAVGLPLDSPEREEEGEKKEDDKQQAGDDDEGEQHQAKQSPKTEPQPMEEEAVESEEEAEPAASFAMAECEVAQVAEMA